jgi:hypothetical protein
MGSNLDTYKGAKVFVEYIEGGGVPEHEETDPWIACPNDDCPGLEILQRDPDDMDTIERICWDPGIEGPSRPTYSSGGEPGRLSYPNCPDCGEEGKEI